MTWHIFALVTTLLMGVCVAALAGAGGMMTVRGRVLDFPSSFPDGSTGFHVLVEGRSAGGETVIVPAGGEVHARPLFVDDFAGKWDARWRDVVGTTEVQDGRLVATGERNEVVVGELTEADVRVQVTARTDVQMGIIVRFQDEKNLILAFHSPAQEVVGFHEVVDGEWGGWISPVPAGELSGETLTMVVEALEHRVTATVTDDRGNTVTSGFTVSRLRHPGAVGLYFDTLAKKGVQRFVSFRVDRLQRTVPGCAVQVMIPALAQTRDSVWAIGERVEVKGAGCMGVTIEGSLDGLTVGAVSDISPVGRGPADSTLFPTRVPSSEWLRFPAPGHTHPACGVVYRDEDTVTNGMPLGGIDTGCIDLETTGLLGYCTIFNTHVPRRGPMNVPILGLSVGGRTWVLCRPEPKDGSGQYQHSATGRPYRLWRDEGWVEETEPMTPVRTDVGLEGVETADRIHYWGHYPVADLEFETGAPVAVGLRAWSPFLPGDVVGSMLPGIVFEVHLRNPTDAAQQGSLAFTFPGPTVEEAGSEAFVRQEITGLVMGVEVTAKDASYVLGVVGEDSARVGGELGSDGGAWAGIARELPGAAPNHPGSSAAVDFSLGVGEAKVVRFVLTWHAPVWNAGGYNWAGAKHSFTHMYAKHSLSARDAAEELAQGHRALLRRVLAWQQAIYTDNSLPVWLRGSLVNVLHLIAEDSLWAQAEPPIPGWVRPEDGLFGLNECPRGCPQIECIPCSFYGSQPLVYFFPKLALSTLRGYKGYQYPDGAPVWIFGGCTGNTPPVDFANPTRGYQFATNGISLAAMVDRYALCHGDEREALVREFYPMLKQGMIWTVNLRKSPDYEIGERIISMPRSEDTDESTEVPTEWFEAPEPGWSGMAAHLGRLHLAQLRIVQRMAQEAGDEKFAEQCAEWIRAAQEAMEEHLWTGSYYRNYLEPETGSRSDLVFGYQLDGQWITEHHGLPGTLPAERLRTTLETIRRCNVELSRHGAVNYSSAEGTPVQVGGYGTYSYFPPEALMLAMTYMYSGERELGLELARRVWENIVCVQRYTWDMPNIMRGDVDTGERTFGNDYYQDMMLWSLPAAIAGEDFGGPMKRGGLVQRVLRAGR